MSGKGWWNSAISGLESKLDGILAEDAHAHAHAHAHAQAHGDAPEKAAADKKLAVEPGGLSDAQRCMSRVLELDGS
jgi:hypothetical protein